MSLIFLIVLICATAKAERTYSKIVNGMDIDYERNKHLVALDLEKEGAKEVNECSGSIISPRWIITAAHCVIVEDGLLVNSAIAYHHSRKPAIAVIPGSNITPHPNYRNNGEWRHIKTDLALLQAVRNIPFNLYISSIELALRVPQWGTFAYISGYGETEDSSLSVPREGNVTIRYTDWDVLSTDFDPVEAGHGDSGGSLVEEGTGRLVGVTSATNHFSTLYANVAERANRNWIRRVMRNRR